MTESDSRFSIVNTPVIAPGICVSCSTADIDDRKFIDFNKEVEYYGVIYICTPCVTELAKLLNFIPMESFEDLHKEYRKLQIDHNHLINKYSKVEDALFALRPDSTSIDSGINSGNSSVSVLEKSKSSDETSKQSDEDDSESFEFASLEGLDDIFNNPNSDK
ncbi:hypothetical protein [Streptomyces hebeiensis]